MPERSGHDMTIGFIGNPNCGKTTLFNAYTGANLKVANWPGVTVEKVEGAVRHHGLNIHLVDLPGTYSLTSLHHGGDGVRQFILSGEVDVIINVVDASALERSLYLTLQLLELGKPVVMALNMMDIVEKRGMEIDLHRLPEMLGIRSSRCRPASAAAWTRCSTPPPTTRTAPGPTPWCTSTRPSPITSTTTTPSTPWSIRTRSRTRSTRSSPRCTRATRPDQRALARPQAAGGGQGDLREIPGGPAPGAGPQL